MAIKVKDPSREVFVIPELEALLNKVWKIQYEEVGPAFIDDVEVFENNFAKRGKKFEKGYSVVYVGYLEGNETSTTLGSVEREIRFDFHVFIDAETGTVESYMGKEAEKYAEICPNVMKLCDETAVEILIILFQKYGVEVKVFKSILSGDLRFRIVTNDDGYKHLKGNSYVSEYYEQLALEAKNIDKAS